MSTEAALAFAHDMSECTIWQPLKEWFLTIEHTMGGIDCPVRIAWAEEDAMIPREPYGARFPELVPDAEWVTLPGVGHVPMYDDPGLVVRTVLELTASVDGRERHTDQITPTRVMPQPGGRTDAGRRVVP